MQTKFQTCQGLTCLPTEFGLKIPSASSKFKNLLPYYHPILICLFHLILKWIVNETQTDDAQLLSDLV